MGQQNYSRERVMEDMQRFMQDQPIALIKENLFELYKGWMFTYASQVDSDQVVNMLLFFDQLKAFLELVYRTNQSQEGY